MDIDFWVTSNLNSQKVELTKFTQLADPEERVLGKHIKQSTGTVAITAEKDGRHDYCFSNQMSSIADKIVRFVPLYIVFKLSVNPVSRSFNVHGVVYVGGEDGLRPSADPKSTLANSLVDVIAPIEREIRALAIGLTSVKDEQEYIVVRERTHRNTAESTNSRVKWWSVLQGVVLFSVVAWQIYYLKVSLGSPFSVTMMFIAHFQSFFEVKRVI